MSDTIQDSFVNISQNMKPVSETDSEPLRTVVLVSGSEQDRQQWQKRFERNAQRIFGSPGIPAIYSLEERLGGKRRQGNFLGTLLAYQILKARSDVNPSDLQGQLILTGMIFGRGERVAPFTQAEGNRKPAVTLDAPRSGERGKIPPLTTVEEAMKYSARLGSAMSRAGFRGMFCKWGDEIQIPSRTYADIAAESLQEMDVVKCVSEWPVSEELASQKDWVLFDQKNRLMAQISRRPQTDLLHVIESFGRRFGQTELRSGISLGSVGVSHRLLDVAHRVFEKELKAKGVYLDFDPYLIQALCLEDPQQWEEVYGQEPGVQVLLKMIPDFGDKVCEFHQEFEKQWGRPIQKCVLDLGPDVLWLDIGQHLAMGDKIMSVLQPGPLGEMLRYMEDCDVLPDAHGNRIIDSWVSPHIELKDSVVIHSVILGAGEVRGSVIKNAVIGHADCLDAFVVHAMIERLSAQPGSGVYRCIQQIVELSEGERAASLLIGQEALLMKASVNLDLKDPDNFQRPVCGNGPSFQAAFEEMDGVSEAELQKRSRQLIRNGVERFLRLLERLNLNPDQEAWVRGFLEEFELFP